MKLDRFINRPVLSTVISILIVLAGYPISGYRPSNRFGKGNLYGCQCANGIE